jgi:hypothetical protein
MKKTALTLILLFGLFPIILCQTVDSIKIEQAGELIKVHYKILNSNQSQVFRVTVYCSINGGLPSVIKSLSGDFGENVVGGRTDYMVLWDVLKDVDEVKSVDFSVRVELLRDATSQNKTKGPINWENKKFYVLPTLGFEGPLTFGLRLAYMRSWGISAMFLRGTEEWTADGETYSAPVNIASLDLTKRVSNKTKFTMHLFTGILFLNFVDKQHVFNVGDIYTEHNYLGMEGGIILSFSRLAFSTGIGVVSQGGVVEIGLGMRF